MGGGNGQKAKMARERNSEKNKTSKGLSFCGLLMIFAVASFSSCYPLSQNCSKFDGVSPILVILQVASLKPTRRL